MDYLRQIEAFYDWLLINELPGDAQAIWHILMHIAWRNNSPEEFSVPNPTFLSALGISRTQLSRMRLKLVQKGRILYTKMHGRNAGRYSIVPFVEHNVTQHDTPSTEKGFVLHNGAQPVTQPVRPSQFVEHNVTQRDTPTLKKVRGEKAAKPGKIQYAEYVTLTQKEYETLVQKHGEMDIKTLINILNNYKGAKPKKRQYESDYRAILSWVEKELEERKSKTPKKGGTKDPEAEQRKKMIKSLYLS